MDETGWEVGDVLVKNGEDEGTTKGWDLLTEAERDSVTGIATFSATLTLIGSLLLVIVHFAMKERKFAQKMVMYLAISNIAASLVTIASSYVEGGSSACKWLGALDHYCSLATVSWTFCMAFHIKRMVDRQRDPKAVMLLLSTTHYHLIAWFSPVVFLIGPLAMDGYGDAGVWCSVRKDLASVLFFYLPIWAVMFHNVVIGLMLTRKATETIILTRTSSSPEILKRHREVKLFTRVQKRVQFYLLIFFNVWAWSSVNRLLLLLNDENPIYMAFFMQALFTPAQGFLNAILYLTTRRQREAYVGVLRRVLRHFALYRKYIRRKILAQLEPKTEEQASSTELTATPAPSGAETERTPEHVRWWRLQKLRPGRRGSTGRHEESPRATDGREDYSDDDEVEEVVLVELGAPAEKMWEDMEREEKKRSAVRARDLLEGKEPEEEWTLRDRARQAKETLKNMVHFVGTKTMSYGKRYSEKLKLLIKRTFEFFLVATYVPLCAWMLFPAATLRKYIETDERKTWIALGSFVILFILPFTYVWLLLSEIMDIDSLNGRKAAVTVVLCIFFGAMFVFVWVGWWSGHSKLAFTAILNPSYTVRPLFWRNIVVEVILVVEFFQMASFAFIDSVPWPRDQDPQDGFDWSTLGLGRSFWKVKFWLSFAGVVLWIAIYTFPLALEQVTGRPFAQRIYDNFYIEFILELLAGPCLITFTSGLSNALDCTYNKELDAFLLDEDESIECWVSSHRKYALLGMTGLVFFFPSAALEPIEDVLADIRFLPLYRMSQDIIKVLLTLMVTFDTEPWASVCITFVACTWLWWRTWKTQPSCIKLANIWKQASLVGASWAAACAMLALAINDRGNVAAVVILALGWAGIFAWFAFQHYWHVQKQARVDAKERVDQLKGKIQQSGVATRARMEKLIALARAGKLYTRRHAVCALAELSSDPQLRLRLLAAGVHIPVVNMVNKPGVFEISQYDYDVGENRKTFEESIRYAMLTLRELAREPEYRMALMEVNVLEPLVTLLHKPYSPYLLLALRTLRELAQRSAIAGRMLVEGAAAPLTDLCRSSSSTIIQTSLNLLNVLSERREAARNMGHLKLIDILLDLLADIYVVPTTPSSPNPRAVLHDEHDGGGVLVNHNTEDVESGTPSPPSQPHSALASTGLLLQSAPVTFAARTPETRNLEVGEHTASPESPQRMQSQSRTTSFGAALATHDWAMMTLSRTLGMARVSIALKPNPNIPPPPPPPPSSYWDTNIAISLPPLPQHRLLVREHSGFLAPSFDTAIFDDSVALIPEGQPVFTEEERQAIVSEACELLASLTRCRDNHERAIGENLRGLRALRKRALCRITDIKIHSLHVLFNLAENPSNCLKLMNVGMHESLEELLQHDAEMVQFYAASLLVHLGQEEEARTFMQASIDTRRLCRILKTATQLKVQVAAARALDVLVQREKRKQAGGEMAIHLSPIQVFLRRFRGILRVIAVLAHVREDIQKRSMVGLIPY